MHLVTDNAQWLDFVQTARKIRPLRMVIALGGNQTCADKEQFSTLSQRKDKKF